MEKIHGLIDAPFTHFMRTGEVNYEPIEAIANYWLETDFKAYLSMVLLEKAIC